MAVAALVIAAGCGGSGSATAAQADRAFLLTVHQQDPTVNQVRSDTQLLRLGSAACAAFASGASFFSLADTMAVNDGGLPDEVLGTVIKAAGEELCPRYRSRVSTAGSSGTTAAFVTGSGRGAPGSARPR
jgi:Protein of unknown function (DUF732)